MLIFLRFVLLLFYWEFICLHFNAVKYKVIELELKVVEYATRNLLADVDQTLTGHS